MADVARRFSSSVVVCRRELRLDIDDAQIAEAAHRVHQGYPGPAGAIVALCIVSLAAAVQEEDGKASSDRLAHRFELLAELYDLERHFREMGLERHKSQMAGMRLALHRLRSAEATTQMIERAVRELCEHCGFDRCAAFRMEENGLVVQAAYFRGQEEWAERWQHFSQQHPARLQPDDIEVELVRRQVPVLAGDPQNSAKGMAEMVRSAETESYVAAPIVANGKVVGTLHADNLFSGRPVDASDRDALGAFAEGFAFALERTALLEGVRAERRRMQQLMATADAGLEDLVSGGIDFQRESDGQVVVRPQGPSALPAAAGPARLRSLLTPRELEVLELMAAGATNANIADRLVVSGATVKSHVRHILRKLHAANRAEAVSKYCRLIGANGAQPLDEG